MYINREISWLEFNRRVLHQAERQKLPLLERVKFLSISASNLDEFFQVRVGGLMLAEGTGKQMTDAEGRTAGEQLEMIRARAAAMVRDQYAALDELMPHLTAEGIAPTPVDSLTEVQFAVLEEYFEINIAPLLTPLAVEVEVPPVLPSLSLIIGLELQDDRTGDRRLVAITLPEVLPRRVHSSVLTSDSYVLLEELVMANTGRLFPGEHIVTQAVFRVTRNGDIAVEEDESSDFARDMEEVLIARKFSSCVRLEIEEDAPDEFVEKISELMGAGQENTYRIPGPLRLADFVDVAFIPGLDHLKLSPWEPKQPDEVDNSLSMFENIAQGDILIHNPYESYDPVVKLVEEAAADPDVLAIKQVLYRTARRSRFIQALCRAAEAGKQVTVLIELKARFDERRNLSQAEQLQRAGVQVVYGVKGFKTHAKVLLIVRRENGLLRRYCHFGTGNYNENTARLYSDLSLLTCNEQLGADASQFFNSVTGLTRLMNFRRIFPSPARMKEKLLDLIYAETRRARLGETAGIRAKMNSLNDEDIMRALEKASAAGVKIDLNIRGICCWAPGTELGRQSTRIVSIVDRYLEHARIFSFHNGGNPLVFIASADWMSRNLDRRVELMVPIETPALTARVLNVLDACFRDNEQAYLILPDGTSRPISAGRQKKFALQRYLQEEADLRSRADERDRKLTLEPHRPKSRNN